LTRLLRQTPRQGGFTLVELIIALAISGLLMVALTSVVLTSVRAASTASDRVEASSQIRIFQSFASDDFARSGAPDGGGCPCTTQPLVLTGTQVSNSAQPVGATVQVTYTWDGSNFVDRQVGSGPTIHAATDVSAFSWYVDTSGGHPTVVVSLTVTVGAYSESQTFRFYPRVNP
jgi:prepilin-type N-terminal cleavage/methylation domain-containing protein